MILRLEVLNVLMLFIEKWRERIIRNAHQKMMQTVNTNGLYLDADNRSYTLKNLTLNNLSELNFAIKTLKEIGHGSALIETLEVMTAQAIFRDYSHK